MIDTTNTSYDYLSAPLVEDGTLNLQGVLNVALSFFDRTRHIVDDAGEKEVILFKQNLPMALLSCSTLNDWSFLIKGVQYEEDDIVNDEPVPCEEYVRETGKGKGFDFLKGDKRYCHVYTTYKDFIFGYKLPRDFMKLKYINGNHKFGYAIKGDVLYCNEFKCNIDYVSKPNNGLPTEFGYLVAYRCAMDMAQHLDHEGTALSRASAMFQTTYTILKQKEDASFKLENPPQNFYIDYDSAYWGDKK